MFEKAIFRMKQNKEIIDKIYDRLYDFLENRKLFNLVDKNLRFSYKTHYLDFCSNNEVCVKSKASKKDMFHLIITPDLADIETIAMKIVSFNGLREEEVIAQFKKSEKKVVVTDKIIEKSVQGKKSEVVTIKNETTIKTFIDNQLRYDYIYESKTGFSLQNNYSKSSLSETFVDENGNAVKRVAFITADDFYQNLNTIAYYESDDFSATPFDDRYSSRLYDTRMNESTKAKFEEFINSQNNQVILKR